MTLHERLAAARERLTSAGVSAAEAAIDVDLYARRILGWSRAQLLVEQHRAAPAALEPTFSEWVDRRALREPTAYIVGMREFWGLEFIVSPAVLIPRPETEFIVEEALRALASGGPRRSPVRLADIGTGSGCVPVAIAHEYRDCRIVASDISRDALVVARQNAVRHGVADRIQFVAASFLDGIRGTFDIMTANPPYVKDGDKPALSREVRHEPEVALFGGPDGLNALTAVLAAAMEKLVPMGWLIMEFGYGQDDAVETLVENRSSLRLDHIRADLLGIPRTAVVQRR